MRQATSVVMLGATGAVGNHAALTLAKLPGVTRLSLLVGRLRKFRGVDVGALGRAMAMNTLTEGNGHETLYWDDIMRLSSQTPDAIPAGNSTDTGAHP